MEKNKSIDGLRTAKKKPVAKKPVAAKPAATVKPTKSTKQPVAKAKKTIAVTEIPDTKAVEKSFLKADREEIAESFLAPTTTFEFDQIHGKLQPAKEEKEPMSTEETPEKPKKKHKKKRIILTIILSILFLLLAAATALMLWGNDIIMKITGGRDNIFGAISTLMSDTYDPLKQNSQGRTNILAFGTSGYDIIAP